jgi:hypothetical protein
MALFCSVTSVLCSSLQDRVRGDGGGRVVGGGEGESRRVENSGESGDSDLLVMWMEVMLLRQEAAVTNIQRGR